MGVIKPPWVSKKWFNKTPFNYCDHFGDEEKLTTVCKICKEEIERLEKYKKEGRDPYDLENVLEDVGKDLALVMAMLSKKAIRELSVIPIDSDTQTCKAQFGFVRTYQRRIFPQ